MRRRGPARKSRMPSAPATVEMPPRSDETCRARRPPEDLTWTLPTRSRCPRTRTRRSRRARPTGPWCRPRRTPPEATLRSVGWGLLLCVVFTVASAYSGLKVGQVMEAAIPISILAIGLARVYRAPLDACSRTSSSPASAGVAGAVVAGADLHAARALHPQARPAPGADGLHLPRRRLPRRPVPDPAAPLLRARDARRSSPTPRPRRSPRCWSPARRAARRRSCCCRPPAIAGVYDFFVTTFQVWKRVRGLPVHPRREDAGRPGEGGRQLRRGGLHPRPRLRDGAALLDDPLRGRLALELRARAAHLDDRAPLPRRRGLPRRRPRSRR